MVYAISRLLRLRFSLRTLFVLVSLLAVVCGLCHYHFVLPTRYAQRFCAAVSGGDYKGAERLFVDSERTFPGTWGNADQIRNSTMSIAPLTWTNLMRGERWILVHVPYGKEMGEFDWDLGICATRRGLSVVYAMT